MQQSWSLAASLAITIGLLSGSLTAAQNTGDSIPGVSTYTVSGLFPTSAFSSYYAPPASTQEPQPALYDPVLNITFPLNLTNPKTIPTNDTDPVFYPQAVVNLSAADASAFVQTAITAILGIGQDSSLVGNCSKCIAALSIAKTLALVVPQQVPNALVSICQQSGFESNSTCQTNFEASTYGAIWTQVLAFADVSGQDGQYICNSFSSTLCPMPTTNPLNVTSLFPKPKPANATAPAASGERVKVLHLSDFHLDPRYSVASEANCTAGLCCRSNVHNAVSAQIALPAPLYGAYQCDTPYFLALAALQSIGSLTGTGNGNSSFAWTVYTGDLVSHDPQTQLSRAYTEYAEVSVYEMFKEYIAGPVFPVLGNHDTNPEAIDSPHSLPGPLGQQFSWNYDHVTSLWQQDGWINSTTAADAALHYAAYSVKNQYGLRIITMNTDFWYHSNYFNFINTTNPDVSGMLGFLIQELQAAEDAGERVWILGHVLTGWDGSNPIDNPTDLFYQIVDRYSPHVIANVFFGHTHEDEIMIYYANNGTIQNSANALTPGWIAPSVTPLTNLNSGFRMYEVDTGSFDIYEAYTFYADVNSFPNLTSSGPTYQFEYSTRDTYGPSSNWSSTAPLNAQFWHGVTEAMETNRTLVEQFNTYQGKSSVKTPNCTSDACATAKICYMRSGSAPLGRQCPQGYGSVQSAFDPPKS
ncbi:MAG: hypothetical protein M1827_006648 [Pycnora praestabilis]|nr:MAG: hypothetical protein M1827_006648 [Pycnora praestabilis]